MQLFDISTVVIFKIPRRLYPQANPCHRTPPTAVFFIDLVRSMLFFPALLLRSSGFVSQEDFISAQLISAQYLSQELKAI